MSATTRAGGLEEVICQPASAQDLQGLLRDDLAKLRQRLDQSRGETPTERTLRKILLRTFEELVDNPARTDLDSYFFRYRDVMGNWRLIWCWGYERLDHEPAPSVVCTDRIATCCLSAVPARVPAAPVARGCSRPGRSARPIGGLPPWPCLLLLLLLGGVGWWLMRPAALVATPAQFTGPVGTRIDCQIMEKGLFKKKDVTHDTIGITWDPRVARFNQATGSIRLTGVGQTKIEFQYDGRKAEVVVVATASANPDKLVIMPGTVDLAVGTTARLEGFRRIQRRHAGRSDRGHRVGPAERRQGLCPWQPGRGPGPGQFHDRRPLPRRSARTARMSRPRPRSTWPRAISSRSMSASIRRPSASACSGKVHIDAVTSDGKHYNLLESSQLKTEVSPGYVATLQRETLQGQRVGNGKLAASFGSGLTAAAAISPLPCRVPSRPRSTRRTSTWRWARSPTSPIFRPIAAPSI